MFSCVRVMFSCVPTKKRGGQKRKRESIRHGFYFVDLNNAKHTGLKTRPHDKTEKKKKNGFELVWAVAVGGVVTAAEVESTLPTHRVVFPGLHAVHVVVNPFEKKLSMSVTRKRRK